ncbi:MAG: TolC family protein [Candidatus Gastranaerophilaceae bacterium]
MKEDEVLKKIIKPFIYTIFIIVLFLIPSFSFATDDKATEAKTPTIKSIINKLIKNKHVKKSAEKLPAESDVAMIKGSIVLSMEDCVNYALKHDPNIRNSEAMQAVQKSAVGQAKSNYFPTLTGGTGYNINNTGYSGDRSDSINNNYYGLNLSVNEMIWDFGRTTANIKMNKFNYEAAGYDLENTILTTIYNVKIDYTAVLAARANEDIYSRSVKINELNVERTKAMYEAGLKSKIDVVNAEVYLTEAKINLLTAQNIYQTALINLNNSMYYINAPEYAIKDTETFNFQKNYSVKNEINVAYDRKNYNESDVETEIKDGAILTSGIEKRDILKTYSFKPFGLSMDDAIKQAYANRPDLKSLELVKKASEESIKAIKKSYLPSVDASAGYSYLKRSDYASNVIGVYAGLDLPVINAMQIKYQIDEGNSYLNIAINNIDLLRKNVYFQIQSYYINMKQLEKRIPLMSERVGQTLENFELADGRYAVGLGNFLELQDAQTNYNNAQLAFVQSVFDYNKARYYLEEAMGQR